MRSVTPNVVLALALMSAPAIARAGDFVWVEGEAPASINVKPNLAGWGRKEFLSGEKWLHLSVDADKVEREVPAGGVLIRYDVPVKAAGAYEVWSRLGFEFVRSPFSWRIDDGEWTLATPDDLTTDLMEVDFFCEVAWLKLGARTLAAGPHVLELKLDPGRTKDGKRERVLCAFDAFCLTRGPFHPDGKNPPGIDGRDDRDRQAAATTFRVAPPAEPSARAVLPLKGLWEVCRDDEQSPGEVSAPIRALPEHPHWRAIAVPGDKNVLRPDLLFAHRIWYRTRVDVPAGMAGRSWFLVFPQNSLNTTVYVNGTFCGFDKNPFARVQVDVTRAVRPGVNEVWVGVRDAWYARTADPANPLKLRKTFNTPIKFFHDGFQDLAYPVWNSPQSGILATPTLVAAGPAYVSDVFVKPSVARRELAAEVAVANPPDRALEGELRWEAVDAATGAVARTFAPRAFRVGPNANSTLALTDAWPDPRLWWPDDPHLYRLRTTLAVGGRAVDVSETAFGFREWRVAGTKFTLNGVVWHLWGDLIGSPATKEEWLERYRKTGQRLMRLATAGQSGETSTWMGLTPDEALDFFDRNGVVVRRNGPVDGEAIGYAFAENDPALKARHGGSEMKVELMNNMRDQLVAQVRGERNHPSIQIWSIENEFAYINLINLIGGTPLMDEYERAEKAVADAVAAADPTRAVMTDGGGALKGNTMPVHGDHYVATLDARYPDLAYEPFAEGGGRRRWRWDGTRPRYIGEDYFATGINPADYAMWGGEIAFQGKAQTRPAVARIYRMLTEGYRWGGHVAAWHLWLGDEAPGQHASNAWRAAFVRQYDTAFAAGRPVRRTFGLFNDTHSDEPLTFTRTLKVGGRPAWSKTTTHAVAPGTSLKFDEDVPVPDVASRAEGELVLTVAAGGREVYRDAKAVSVLPEPGPQELRGLSSLGAGGLAVLDPSGEVTRFLSGLGVPFSKVSGLDALPDAAKVLVVGRDVIDRAGSTSSRLAAYAAPGRTVIVLDQTQPLRYQATPAGLEPASHVVRDGSGIEATIAEGRTAFLEDAGHPAFRGLAAADFFTWAPDHVVYRHTYLKPARNGRSLVQVGPRLAESALVEVPAGKGLLLLCQLDVSRKLAAHVVARRLLANLIDRGATYRQEFRPVAAVVDDPNLSAALDAIGLRYEKASAPADALARPGVKLAVVSATPSNLRALAADLPRLRSFTAAGGYLVLHGLTPDGLADYNRVVGVEHLIRPFRRERVTFPAVRSPLTAGLTTGDVVLLSGERIFNWTADEYVVSDMFRYVVDLDEVAPFAASPFFAFDKITNGFVGSDGWPLIIDFPAPKDGKPFEVEMTLPRAETVTEYTHVASTNYSPTTGIELAFDDGKPPAAFALKPTNDPQTFAIDPPRTARKVTLRITSWQPPVPGKAPNVGIDNINLKVARPPQFQATVRPMLNVGGLVHYTQGDGGVVLCNLNFKAAEAVPVNAVKKRTILAALLRNLRAPFSGGNSVIAGAGLSYAPVDLSRHANQYRNERGWFGDRATTFAALPTGRQTFADVSYQVADFATSPVPTVVMLGGPGIPNNPPAEVRGIPVGRKADALYFLHAARIDRRRGPGELREKKSFEIARYVVHYADGATETVPVRGEVDVDDYRQASPAPLPGAQVAWTRPYEGTGLSDVAYAKPWDNPRPGVEIRSLDVLPGADRGAGTLALIAVTAATANP